MVYQHFAGVLNVGENAHLPGDFQGIEDGGRNGLAALGHIAATIVLLLGIAPLGIGHQGLAAAVAYT